VTNVRTSDGDTNDFPINIGMHQGSALSLYLFALLMNEVTRDIQVVSLGVYFLQMMWFWWMRVGRELTRSWNCGDSLWRQKKLGLVGLKQST
jgi:hypothetical protein